MYISKIYKTRPENLSDIENNAYELLEKLDIEFKALVHDETATMEACEDVEKVLDINICKNLFLANRQNTDFYLLIMEGNKDFRTKDVSKQLNSSRLSFGNKEYMEKFLKVEPGSVSALCLMYDKDLEVKVVIDKDILDEEYFGMHPCKNTGSLKIRTKDLINKILPYTGHEPIYVEID